MARMFTDPPEVRQYAMRGDPPINMWPGSPKTREDIMMAGGNPKDWFRYGHRLRAYEEAWMEFIDARRRRKDFTRGFDWNQILILGDYGAGKTTLATHLALKWFRLGHPVFSNASCLIGWHLKHEQLYTALGFMPSASLLLVDESSAALSSRVGHGVAVATFAEMNLNTRKRNGIIVYMSAQDWEIAAPIRRNCKEVWMPIPKRDLELDTGSHNGEKLPPHSDPDNFRMVWHVWDDYPYRKANLIEGKNKDDTEGFGPPTYTMYDDGENVRRSFLLTDTFELAQAGAATIADREQIKEELVAFRDGSGPTKYDTSMSKEDRDHQERIGKLLEFFGQRAGNPPEFFTATEMGIAMDIHSTVAGRVVQTLFPGLTPKSGKGYSTAEIYTRLDAMMAEMSGA